MDKQISQMTDDEFTVWKNKARKAPKSAFFIFNSECLGFIFFDKNNYRVYKDSLFCLGCRSFKDIQRKGFLIQDRPKRTI
jgi:hypothetical protein